MGQRTNGLEHNQGRTIFASVFPDLNYLVLPGWSDMNPLVSGAGLVLKLLSPVRGGIKLPLNQLNALQTNPFILARSWRPVPKNSNPNFAHHACGRLKDA